MISRRVEAGGLWRCFTYQRYARCWIVTRSSMVIIFRRTDTISHFRKLLRLYTCTLINILNSPSGIRGGRLILYRHEKTSGAGRKFFLFLGYRQRFTGFSPSGFSAGRAGVYAGRRFSAARRVGSGGIFCGASAPRAGDWFSRPFLWDKYLFLSLTREPELSGGAGFSSGG